MKKYRFWSRFCALYMTGVFWGTFSFVSAQTQMGVHIGSATDIGQDLGLYEFSPAIGANMRISVVKPTKQRQVLLNPIAEYSTHGYLRIGSDILYLFRQKKVQPYLGAGVGVKLGGDAIGLYTGLKVGLNFKPIAQKYYPFVEGNLFLSQNSRSIVRLGIMVNR